MKKSDAHIVENIRKYIPLTVEEAALFLNFFKPHKVRKNEIFTQQGNLYAPFILIKSGCLMTYFTDLKGQVHVIQFGIDMWWTGDLNAFLNQQASQYSIKAMLDSELLILDLEAFNQLLQTMPALEKYFRILFQNSLISHQQRILGNISYTAEQHYIAFIQRYPSLELIVPQKYIASYLGITPEFLSATKRKLSGK